MLLYLAILVVSEAACTTGSATSPEASAVGGLYVLALVDGAPLPVPPPSPGSSVPCPSAITDGSLSLLPAGVERPQLYSISVYASRACDPDGIPAEPTYVVNEAGSWSISGSRIGFVPSRYFEQGAHEGTLQRTGSAPEIVVAMGGRTYTFRSTQPARDQAGTVAVQVVDEQGARVAGALLVFRSADGLVTRGASSASGPAFATSVAPGTLVVGVRPPTGYAIAPAQVNPVTATVAPGQTTQLTLVLAKIGQ